MGGRAFPDVEPVPVGKIPHIVSWYTTVLSLPERHYALLGSTGKKPLCGDIDIAVSEDVRGYDDVVRLLKPLIGANNINEHGRNLRQIYTRYHDPSGAKYQVDLMIGKVDLLAFTHFSPDPSQSAYTGSHRTELIKTIAKMRNEHQVFIGDRMIARVGETLYHDRGLVYSERWCPPRKDGKGYTTKMVAVSPEDIDRFYDEFPQISPLEKMRAPCTDPRNICFVLFNRYVDPNELNSYESVCSVLRSIGSSYWCDLIWKLYTERLTELKLPHPERLI